MALSIVCYSHTGNNRVLAEHLAERLQCGITWIVERRRRNWLRIVLDLAFRLSPTIESVHTPLTAYRQLILMGPIWASQLASPLRTFLAEHQGEIGEYSFITLCGYDRPAQHQRLIDELTRRVGHSPRAVCQLPIADLLPRYQRNDVRAVTPHRISDDDLVEYETAISVFLREAGLRPALAELKPSPHDATVASAQPS